MHCSSIAFGVNSRTGSYQSNILEKVTALRLSLMEIYVHKNYARFHREMVLSIANSFRRNAGSAKLNGEQVYYSTTRHFIYHYVQERRSTRGRNKYSIIWSPVGLSSPVAQWSGCPNSNPSPKPIVVSPLFYLYLPGSHQINIYTNRLDVTLIRWCASHSSSIMEWIIYTSLKSTISLTSMIINVVLLLQQCCELSPPRSPTHAKVPMSTYQCLK